MTVECRLLQAEDQEPWDAYVHNNPHGTFFHRSAWSHVIEESFRHKPYYLISRRAGRVTGVLPLIRIKTLLFGDSLISTPYCVHGGPLSDDAESLSALMAMAKSLMAQLNIPACEIRGATALGEGWTPSAPFYANFRKPLPRTAEETLKAIPRKQRAVVRKAIEHGLTSAVEASLDPFFGLYAESLRDHGTPMFPRKYFTSLLKHFGKDVEILSVYDNATPVCSVLCFVHKNEILPYYAGGNKMSRRVGGHDFMYWEVMRRAVDRGLTSFDFGRSKINTGAYDFKRNWGFEPTPLTYSWHVRAGHAIPEHNPLNPKYRLMIAAWKRLPVRVANVIGPHLIRGLG
jgi:FemAB-related protein (PEP-CTERM system-associated)